MLVLGARGATGYVLGRGAGSAAANWWEAGGATNCVAAYQPKGAASLAASYVNLANPGTYNAAPGVAPTWDAVTGWIFNGLTQYLATGGLAAVFGSWSAIVRFSDIANASSNGYLFGHSGFGIRGASAAVTHTYVNIGSLTVAGNVTTGILAATNRGYNNGVDEGSLTGSTTRTNSVVIGGINTGTPFLFTACKMQAIAFYNTTLSAAQVAAITTAMQAL